MVQKPWGAGSLSVPLCLLGVLFSCNLPGGFCLGDAVFSLAGLSAWSAGSGAGLAFFQPPAGRLGQMGLDPDSRLPCAQPAVLGSLSPVL